MADGIAEIVARMRTQPAAVRFSELRRVCETYFGPPRQSGTSHLVFKTSWHGDPRVNIQNDKGKAKAYQVRQVLRAIEKVEAGRPTMDNDQLTAAKAATCNTAPRPRRMVEIGSPSVAGGWWPMTGPSGS